MFALVNLRFLLGLFLCLLCLPKSAFHYARHKSLIKLKFNVMQMATLGISEVAPPDGFISDLICSPGLHSRARDVACLGLWSSICVGLSLQLVFN